MPYEGNLAELRTSIEQDYRREEPAALVPLLDEATAAPRLLTQVQALAARLAEGVRAAVASSRSGTSAAGSSRR